MIGGGLTAIDTATELLAYYPVQVEKIMHRYEKLCADWGEDAVRSRYDEEELAILDEFLTTPRPSRQNDSVRKPPGKPDFLLC